MLRNVSYVAACSDTGREQDVTGVYTRSEWSVSRIKVVDLDNFDGLTGGRNGADIGSVAIVESQAKLMVAAPSCCHLYNLLEVKNSKAAAFQPGGPKLNSGRTSISLSFVIQASGRCRHSLANASAVSGSVTMASNFLRRSALFSSEPIWAFPVSDPIPDITFWQYPVPISPDVQILVDVQA
jgi:hypothetical protein